MSIAVKQTHTEMLSLNFQLKNGQQQVKMDGQVKLNFIVEILYQTIKKLIKIKIIIKLTLYNNIKKKKIKGFSVRYCSYDGAADHFWHVLVFIILEFNLIFIIINILKKKNLKLIFTINIYYNIYNIYYNKRLL